MTRAGDGRLLPNVRAPHAAPQLGMEPQVSVNRRRASAAAASSAGGARSRGPQLAVHAQKIGETKIRARISPFVVQRAFAGRDQRTAALHKPADRSALRVREASD